MTDAAQPAVAFMPQILSNSDDVIASSLAFVRKHLEMDVAYLSEFVGDNLVFRAVDAPGFEDVVAVGGQMPLADVYCQHILEGRLPNMIPDTAQEPFAQTIPVTAQLPIGTHVSVPVHRTDGSVFGMFCCLGRTARPTLNDRDLEVVRAFAALSSDQVNTRLTQEALAMAKRDKIQAVLDSCSFDIALQPIQRLRDMGTAGFEALCRFRPQPYRPPNEWFDDAAEVGLQVALELVVMNQAFELLHVLPAHCYLAVNTSAETLATGRIAKIIPNGMGHQVVVEITEHAAIHDLDILLMEIDRLRELDVRIAVDDAGAGYSGLQQIIRLRPDVIKLDMSLTQNVDKDVARRSLASAMVKFGSDTKARVVAEGIETEAEMQTLKSIGIELGQGYHLGRPGPPETMLKLTKSA